MSYTQSPHQTDNEIEEFLKTAKIARICSHNKDFLNIKLGEDKKSLTFDFFNANYANYINEINLKKESEENP